MSDYPRRTMVAVAAGKLQLKDAGGKAVGNEWINRNIAAVDKVRLAALERLRDEVLKARDQMPADGAWCYAQTWERIVKLAEEAKP